MMPMTTVQAEESNKGALHLYENLGFCREKRLQKYYLNGSDAFRMFAQGYEEEIESIDLDFSSEW